MLVTINKFSLDSYQKDHIKSKIIFKKLLTWRCSITWKLMNVIRETKVVIENL